MQITCGASHSQLTFGHAAATAFGIDMANLATGNSHAALLILSLLLIKVLAALQNGAAGKTGLGPHTRSTCAKIVIVFSL